MTTSFTYKTYLKFAVRSYFTFICAYLAKQTADCGHACTQYTCYWLLAHRHARHRWHYMFWSQCPLSGLINWRQNLPGICSQQPTERCQEITSWRLGARQASKTWRAQNIPQTTMSYLYKDFRSVTSGFLKLLLQLRQSRNGLILPQMPFIRYVI